MLEARNRNVMYTMPWILWAWLGCLRVNDDQVLVQDDNKFDAPGDGCAGQG